MNRRLTALAALLFSHAAAAQPGWRESCAGNGAVQWQIEMPMPPDLRYALAFTSRLDSTVRIAVQVNAPGVFPNIPPNMDWLNPGAAYRYDLGAATFPISEEALRALLVVTCTPVPP